MPENTITAVCEPIRERVEAPSAPKPPRVDANAIETLGWSKADALETRMRLLAFSEDWDDPRMEAYDAL